MVAVLRRGDATQWPSAAKQCEVIGRASSRTDDARSAESIFALPGAVAVVGAKPELPRKRSGAISTWGASHPLAAC